jgi:membrane protein implicated in regulation of membrane protease activity
MKTCREWLGTLADVIQVTLFVAATGAFVAAAAGRLLHLPTGWAIALVAAVVVILVVAMSSFARRNRRSKPSTPAAPAQRRIGLLGRKGSFSNVSDASFSDSLDVAIDNSGTADASRARFGVPPKGDDPEGD